MKSSNLTRAARKEKRYRFLFSLKQIKFKGCLQIKVYSQSLIHRWQKIIVYPQLISNYLPPTVIQINEETFWNLPKIFYYLHNQSINYRYNFRPILFELIVIYEKFHFSVITVISRPYNAASNFARKAK